MMLHRLRILSRTIYIPAFFGLANLLSACAILSVDVDVYKGPLMNEESIQMTQLLAITDGAKPLLITLRNTLEWGNPMGNHPVNMDGYIDGYMDPEKLTVRICYYTDLPDPTCNKFVKGFQNPLATRVNEVLAYLENTKMDKKSPLDPTTPTTDWSLRTLGLAFLNNLKKPSTQLQLADIKEKQVATLEAYASFAARILFIANHDGLLAEQKSPGLIFGGLGNLSRGLFGDLATETLSPGVWWDNINGTGTLARRLRSQYVRTLQAVGNSILVLVNELQAQQEAHAGGALRAKTEAAAIESAFMADPFKVYMNLLHELEEEKKGQKVLAGSLDTRLKDIDKEMNTIETGTSQVTDKGNWNNAKAKAETDYNALLGKPTGALKLLDIQNLSSAFEKLTGIPASQEEAWNAIYTQTQKALNNDELTKNAKEHLETLKNSGGIVLDLTSYPKTWKSVENKLKEERSSIETQKKTLDKLNRLLALFTEKEEKSNSTKIAKDKEAALNTTYTIVKDAKNTVLEKLANQETFTSSKGVYLTLAITLGESKIAAGSDSAKQTSIQTALDEMNQRTPPPSFAITPNLSDAKEVLDQEIALLRQEHIQAVRNGGNGSDSVGKALAALETALQHRAGMVRLRPASAYLRTSYPSTSLQEDPNLTWDNLLLQQGLRDIPFSSYLAELFNPDRKHDESISAELDKQYWQNINRVRVSGVGTTNYVLAKDDVGNWYVKHYYGDTSRIFESARKLGMYNLASAGGNASLLAALKKPPVKNDESDSAPQPTQLQRVFARHRTAYDTQTKTDMTTLHDLTIGDGLRAAIKDGWKPLSATPNESMEGTLATLLSAPANQLKESMAKIERDDKTRSGVKVVQGLQAIHSFHRAVRINIDNLPSDQMKTDTKKAALQTLTHTIQDKLSGFSDNRQRLIQEYEQAIMFIGEATTPQGDQDKKAN